MTKNLTDSNHVDLVIPVFNNKEYTELCIDSIISNTSNVPYHIIVIDNGSSDGTGEYLEELSKRPNLNITIIKNKENLGWCKALNQGIRACNSRHVCFMNNDIIVTEGWLKKMLDKFDNSVAAVGPTSNAVLGKQHVSYNRPGVIVEPTIFIVGLCLLIRRDILEILYRLDKCYIDERFGIGCSEELDLAIRVRKLGFTMLIARDVYIHHFFSKTLQMVVKDYDAHIKEKHQILVDKWGQAELDAMFGYTPKILIGIPTLGGIPIKFFLSCLTTNMPYQIAWEPVSRTLPDIARNILVDIALEHSFDLIWFLDDDMAWNDRDILMKMVKYNLDIIGVQAHTRLPPYYPCVFEKVGEFYRSIDVSGKGLIEVDALGGACFLVKTDVFRKMERPWFEFKPVRLYGLDQERIGEDIYFFKKAKAKGFKVYCDGNIDMWHIGERMLIGRETWQQYQEDFEKRLNMITKIKLAEE